MNSNDIFDGITDIRDDLIIGAKETPKKQKRKGGKRWLGAVAAIMIIAVLGHMILKPGGQTGYAIAQAQYPEMAPYPGGMEFNAAVYDAWWESVTAQRRELGDITSLQLFFTRCAQTFLTKEEGKNLTCSPLNIYMALSMLAQLTGGESREQILTLLGSDSMDSLRQQAGNVWNSSYRNDGALTSILASSLWLNRDVKFNHDTMDILARDFYSSSYQGEMGSAEFNKVLQSWLSEQTEGILEKQAANIEMEDDTILALAATVCFKAKWHNEFLKEKTESNIFHAPGGDVEAGFMPPG